MFYIFDGRLQSSRLHQHQPIRKAPTPITGPSLVFLAPTKNVCKTQLAFDHMLLPLNQLCHVTCQIAHYGHQLVTTIFVIDYYQIYSINHFHINCFSLPLLINLLKLLKTRAKSSQEYLFQYCPCLLMPILQVLWTRSERTSLVCIRITSPLCESITHTSLSYY